LYYVHAMFEIKVSDRFSAAHSLREYRGDCERLHGHNYRVEVRVSSPSLNNMGIAIDFRELKDLLRSVINQLDHTYLNDLPGFKDINPSSENIAKYIYNFMAKSIALPVRLLSVEVWETENSSALYREG